MAKFENIKPSFMRLDFLISQCCYISNLRSTNFFIILFIKLNNFLKFVPNQNVSVSN